MQLITEKRQDHDSLVLSMAKELSNEGYNVRVALEGWDQPNKYYGRIPDVDAFGPKHIIAEAETQDTISSPNTREQFEALSRIPNAEFHVIVPRECLDEMKSQVRLWNIRVDQYWHPSQLL